MKRNRSLLVYLIFLSAWLLNGSVTRNPFAYFDPQIVLTYNYEQKNHLSPAYSITSLTPVLSGSDDPRVRVFNLLAGRIVTEAVTDFELSLRDLPQTDNQESASFDVRVAETSRPGRLISLVFAFDGRGMDEAIPFHFVSTLNFDLEQGVELSLGDLFQAGTDYLSILAGRCRALSISSGTGPPDARVCDRPESYINWNVAVDGLIFTFAEYPVDSGAKGDSTLLIPYPDLADYLDRRGPLSPYLP
jgi:hypothetical protein